MPEVLGSPPSPRVALFWNGTAWQWALVDAAGHLQIDAVSLLGLEGALQSVGTDRFQVRGEDQLFSFRECLLSFRTGIISGAGGFYESVSPAANRVWHVTNVLAVDITSPTTAQTFNVQRGANAFYFHHVSAAIPAGQWLPWGGHVYLQTGDTLRVIFTGGLAGDSCAISITGYLMTLET